MSTNTNRLRETRILEIMGKYTADGWQVERQPQLECLPEDLRPDIAAHKEGANKAIDVTTRAALSVSDRSLRLAQILNPMPDWEYILNLLAEPQYPPAPETARPLTTSETLANLAQARRAQKEHLSDAAFMLAWAAAQAALHTLITAKGVPERRPPAVAYAAYQALDLDVLDNQEYEALNDLWRTHNAIVHGFTNDRDRPQSLQTMMDMATQLVHRARSVREYSSFT